MNKLHLEQEPDDIISYDKIRELTEPLRMGVTWRKLNYYKSLGLLPKATRKQGDKRGYYPVSTYYDLIVYHFLQNNLGFTLEEIKNLVKDSKVQALFAKWIQQTYGYFITYMQQKIRGQHFQGNGVTWIVMFNSAYKRALLKTGIEYLAKSVSKTQSEKIIEDSLIAKKADEWATKAVAGTLGE